MQRPRRSGAGTRVDGGMHAGSVGATTGARLRDLAGRAIAVVVPVHARDLALAVHVARDALQPAAARMQV